MKNVARACTFGFFASTAVVAMLTACWPLAPSGGSIEDAASSGSVSRGGSGDSSAVDGGATSDEGGGGKDDGSSNAGDSAVPIVPYPSVTIAAGIGFGCTIDSSGTVWCWGNNTFGQAGSSDAGAVATTPQQVPVVAGATAIALGDYHTCAVTATHAVYCWGLNNSYQLGHPPGSPDQNCQGSVPCTATPAPVDGIVATSIAAAGARTCVVQIDGTTACWGAVQDAEDAGTAVACGLGTAAGGGTCSASPYTVSGITGAAQLAVGFEHACAVVQEAGVVCWGQNDESQVSLGFCAATCPPTAQSSLSAASVAVGTKFSCALVADGGTVSCFGDNAHGELGHAPGALGDLTLDGGAPIYNGTPQTVGGLGSVEELVASGSQAACALVSGGMVECWGNVAGDAAAGTPVAVSLPAMNALGVPDSDYACGVATDGAIWCWYLASSAAPIPILLAQDAGSGPLQP